MIDFQAIKFNDNLSDQRIAFANKTFGEKVVKRIIAFALFLLGVNRSIISTIVNIPLNTVKSNIKALFSTGISAIEDRRNKTSSFLPHSQNKSLNNVDQVDSKNSDINESNHSIEVIFGEKKKVIDIPLEKNKLVVDPSNPLLFKSLVLSFMGSDFLTAKEASELLGFTERYVCQLSKKLQDDDIISLIDKRQGQQNDYVFTTDVKAELIQQYTVNILTGSSTSSTKITSQINEALDSSVSQRGVRKHVLKLGLNKIKKNLLELVNDRKKNSKK